MSLDLAFSNWFDHMQIDFDSLENVSSLDVFLPFRSIVLTANFSRNTFGVRIARNPFKDASKNAGPSVLAQSGWGSWASREAPMLLGVFRAYLT